jgi:undecaprenyl diphosphate synthase
MSLSDVLAAVPPGSPEDALARRVDFGRLPRHIAIIMDGNGRWAAARHSAARRRPSRRHRRRP